MKKQHCQYSTSPCVSFLEYSPLFHLEIIVLLTSLVFFLILHSCLLHKSHSFIFIVFELYIKRIKLFVLFCVWLLLLNRILVKFIHTVVPVIEYSSTLLYNISLGEYTKMHLSLCIIVEHFCCF